MSSIKTFNPDFKAVIEEKLERQLFMKMIGFRMTSIEVGEITGEIDIEKVHKQHKGFVHGGISAIISDIVAGFAAVSVVGPGEEVVTVELKVSYYNPGVTNKLFARGWVAKQGRKLNFCEAEIWEIRDGDRVTVAKATTTMATITQEDIKKSKH